MQTEMCCDTIADFFTGITSVIAADDCKEPASGVFVVMFLAVDTCETTAVVFHNSQRFVAAFDYVQ